MSYYFIRVGEGAKYIEEAKKHNFVAIGWAKTGDLSSQTNLETIKRILSDHYSYSSAQLSMQAGQIYRFVHEIKNGDVVISPLGKGEYLVGKVGNYFYQNEVPQSCPYQHRRHIEWSSRVLLKENMSSNLAYSLGAIMTVFSLDKYTDEIEALIEGKELSPAEKPARIRDIIINGLLELDGKQFEEFVCHLLSCVGFVSQTTQYVSDKGIDVNGVLDAEGLAEIILRVQVKRVRHTIGNKDILAMRGTLAQGEHACFITLSEFSKQAQEEAEAAGKIAVKLIDGEDLATLVLKNYDNIDDKYKSLFPMKKRKDFNPEDLFEYSVDAPEAEAIQEENNNKFDTLVCAAKEDGFKRAFLDQKAWWAVRINENKLSQIKYLAIYQVAPVSAITYYGEVDKIEPYENSNKYKLYLKEIHQIQNPIVLGRNPHLKPQGPRYTTIDNILKGKTLDDIFDKN
jgi:restriction system protein